MWCEADATIGGVLFFLNDVEDWVFCLIVLTCLLSFKAAYLRSFGAGGSAIVVKLGASRANVSGWLKKMRQDLQNRKKENVKRGITLKKEDLHEVHLTSSVIFLLEIKKLAYMTLFL